MTRESTLFSRFEDDLRSANTRKISAEAYARHYREWGGSFIVHPEVLRFFEHTYDVKVSYRGYFRNGQCVGAVPIWGQFVAGDRSALQANHLQDKEDFGYPVICLPIDPRYRCTVLYKAKYLLNLQRRQIGGAIFSGFKAMSILKRIPDDLPGKTQYQLKQRRFERLGGVVRDVQDFCGEEIAAI